MLLQKDMKLAEVILHDHCLVPVINRFGIKLGFGDSSIENICNKMSIDTDFFLIILNAFHDPQYLDNKYLQSFSVDLLIQYLQKTHQYYLNNKIPEIEELIDELGFEIPDDGKSILLVKKFFADYKTELVKHIEREENKVYPYVLELNRKIENNSITPDTVNWIKDYSITSFEEEHDNVEEKLDDLKSILIKYLSTSEKQDIRYRLLKELSALENDLNDHARIEDMILVPKVMLLENRIMEND